MITDKDSTYGNLIFYGTPQGHEFMTFVNTIITLSQYTGEKVNSEL